MQKKKTSQEFCLDLLGLSVLYKKALANVVISLSSDRVSQVAVGLSLSPLCHYQYSSISKSVANISKDIEANKERLLEIQKLQLSYLGEHLESRIRLITDCTPLLKRHSDCLSERHYVAVANNKVLNNKPVDVGYQLSSVFVGFEDKWVVPLEQHRLGLSENALDSAVTQIKNLLTLKPLCEEDLIINTADSAYGTPRFLSPLYDHFKLVNVVRLRAGIKLWTQNPRSKTGGANGIYGDCYYLNLKTQDKTYTRKGESYQVHQVSIYDLPPTETHTLEAQTNKGRKVQIKISRWPNMLRRGNKENSMKHKPMDIIGILVMDAKTQKPVFDRPQFIAIAGQQKSSISSLDAYQEYRHRCDIEAGFRFQKQKLLLQNYQTPDVQTLDNWLLVVQLAHTLLFLAADEAQHTCHKWQKAYDKPKPKGQRLSPCQTQKAAQSLFLTFDKTPFIPQKSEKGKGRQKGTKFTPRPSQKVNKKQRRQPQNTPK